ncbi:MAG: isoprenylcysteine carboxylmethyltransferase family protein [Pseudomonadota bacterium]
MIQFEMRASPGQLVRNYLAVMSLLLAGYLFYSLVPHYDRWFSSVHKLPGFKLSDKEILAGIVVAYAILLVPFYASFDDGVVTKSRHVWNALLSFPSRMPTPQEKIALLSTAVKAFFLPLMTVWLVSHFASIYHHGMIYWNREQFFPHGYWLLFNLILLIDVTFFTLGYALEHPKLKNEIRTVEPWFSGWFVALICYPPFNGATNQMLAWHSSDYPRFDDPVVQTIGGIAILVLMGIYAWASVALNLKASNLTNRGIVRTGPYAFVRHPAYCTKTLAWWIGALPILANKWDDGMQPFLYGLFSVTGWSLIYYLRAMTEERHLRLDPEYPQYCEKVKYQFIPRIW